VLFFAGAINGVFVMDKIIQQNTDVPESYQAIMTVHDLALYLKLSDAMIYRLARARKLPVVRFGKTLRFQKKQIDAWLHENSIKSLEPE
jgi:excisionase family DNA binding protein